MSYLAVDEEKRNGYDGQGKHCVVWRENNTKGCDFNVRRNLIEVRKRFDKKNKIKRRCEQFFQER